MEGSRSCRHAPPAAGFGELGAGARAEAGAAAARLCCPVPRPGQVWPPRVAVQCAGSPGDGLSAHARCPRYCLTRGCLTAGCARSGPRTFFPWSRSRRPFLPPDSWSARSPQRGRRGGRCAAGAGPELRASRRGGRSGAEPAGSTGRTHAWPRAAAQGLLVARRGGSGGQELPPAGQQPGRHNGRRRGCPHGLTGMPGGRQRQLAAGAARRPRSASCGHLELPGLPHPVPVSTLLSFQLLGDLKRPLVCLFKMGNKKQSCPEVGVWGAGWCFRGQWVKSHHLAWGIYTFLFYFFKARGGVDLASPL